MRTIHINAKAQGATRRRVTGFVLNPRDLTLTHLAVRTHGLLPADHVRLNIRQRTLSQVAHEHGVREVAS